MRQQRKRLVQGLGNEQPVERIAVMIGQCCDCDRVLYRYRQQLKASRPEIGQRVRPR